MGRLLIPINISTVVEYATDYGMIIKAATTTTNQATKQTR